MKAGWRLLQVLGGVFIAVLSTIAAPYPAVLRWDRVQVFAQPNSESAVLGEVSRGSQLTVLEDFIVPASGQRPLAERWSRVAWRRSSVPAPPAPAPASVPGAIQPGEWVYSQHVNDRQQVAVSRLNVRSGPGTDFAVVRQIDRGTVVNVLERRGNWLGIGPKPAVAAPRAPAPEVPVQTDAYVKSQYLAPIYRPPAAEPASAPAFTSGQRMPLVEASTAPPAPVATPPPSPPHTQQPQASQAPSSFYWEETRPTGPKGTLSSESGKYRAIQPPPVQSAPKPVAPQDFQPQPPPRSLPQVVVQDPIPGQSSRPISPQGRIPRVASSVQPPAQPPITYRDQGPRIVTRDGVVRRALEPRSPGDFELRSHRGEGLINFLVPADDEIKLGPWVGRRVLITGEESVDAAWRRYPVIHVQSIRPTF